MPKVEIDYSNTIIYKITCKDPNNKDVYVGHTTNFVQRKHAHKQSCINSDCKVYTVIRDSGGWTNWKMEIVSFFDCKNHYEARVKEQEYYTLLNATLNSVEPLPPPKKVVIKEKKPKNPKKIKEIFFCNKCSITCDNLTSLSTHNLTKKHLKKLDKVATNTADPASENAKNAKIFLCEICDFKCSKGSDYTRHKMTSKHINASKMFLNTDEPLEEVQFICECGKQYKHRQSLHVHKKKCNKTCVEEAQTSDIIELLKQVIQDKTPNNIMLEILKQNNEFKELLIEQKNILPANNDELVAELLKQNNEFKELMLEQSKYMMELASKAVNNTNCNNKTFNLTFYLNETCKDAVNFIKSLALQLSDLDYTRKYGYVAGITNILLRGLKAIDVNKRPFHCCDLKREIIYIKHDGVWEKDDNNKSKMIKAIKQLTHRNFLQVEEWRNKNPSSRDVESKKNTEYLYIIREVLGGPIAKDDASNFSKIIRNVMKEILIDKRISI